MRWSAGLAWSAEFDPEALDELSRLDKPVQRRWLRYLRERIATEEDPRRFGRPLRGEYAGLWRCRVGDFRLICAIQEPVSQVLVLRVGHRRERYG